LLLLLLNFNLWNRTETTSIRREFLSCVGLRHLILQEVVELDWVRVQPQGLEVVHFLIGDVNLEAYDISVLNYTMGEDVVRVHELDLARFDFLGKDGILTCDVRGDITFVTSYNLSGVQGSQPILSLISGNRSFTLLVRGI